MTGQVLITAGYAQAARSGVWHEVGTLLNSYPDVLIATIGLALICLVGVISIRAIRRRVRREVWWTVHLWLYLALALSFAHVVVLGPSFAGHPLTQLAWSVAWAGTAGLVLVYRFGLPVLRSVRHRLRVAEVWPEGPGVVSVICRGEHLDRLPISGGQFLFWRFLTGGMWWQAHPYTVSALPVPPYLRLTVKGVGDHSAALARLKPGTLVAIEGPYGVFTRHTRPATLTLPSAGTSASPSRAPATQGIVGPGAVRSATGAAEQFGYGVLDVKVTVSGTRITDVSVPTLEVAEYTSQQICDQAIPLLRSEVLTAQSARIDGVSGATYTSEAYAASLQAALDALHPSEAGTHPENAFRLIMPGQRRSRRAMRGPRKLHIFLIYSELHVAFTSSTYPSLERY